MEYVKLDFEAYVIGTDRDSDNTVYKYDTNRVAEITLPEAVEAAKVYFWTLGMDSAIGVNPSSISNKILLVDIPDSILETEGSEVKVYISLTDDVHIATDYEGRIPIVSRPLFVRESLITSDGDELVTNMGESLVIAVTA